VNWVHSYQLLQPPRVHLRLRHSIAISHSEGGGEEDRSKPGGQAARRPGGQAARRPSCQAARRIGGQAARRPGGQAKPAVRRPGDKALGQPARQAARLPDSRAGRAGKKGGARGAERKRWPAGPGAGSGHLLLQRGGLLQLAAAPRLRRLRPARRAPDASPQKPMPAFGKVKLS